MAGRTPTPTAILKLRGSQHAGKRPAEPQPVLGKPRRPSHKEKSIWDATCAALDSMNTLHKTDGNAIARYAEMQAA